MSESKNIALNLPPYEFKVQRTSEGKTQIFDTLRRRWVSLTPEEWVRQRFVQWLISEKGYPAALMANEVSLCQNGISRRCDTLVGDNTGRPVAIVEYKAPSVEVTQAVFDQIVRYNSVLRARCLMVSNGITHFCCLMNYEKNSYSFLQDVPTYQELIG